MSYVLHSHATTIYTVKINSKCEAFQITCLLVRKLIPEDRNLVGGIRFVVFAICCINNRKYRNISIYFRYAYESQSDGEKSKTTSTTEKNTFYMQKDQHYVHDIRNITFYNISYSVVNCSSFPLTSIE